MLQTLVTNTNQCLAGYYKDDSGVAASDETSSCVESADGTRCCKPMECDDCNPEGKVHVSVTLYPNTR